MKVRGQRLSALDVRIIFLLVKVIFENISKEKRKFDAIELIAPVPETDTKLTSGTKTRGSPAEIMSLERWLGSLSPTLSPS